jgi:hypothetical protein
MISKLHFIALLTAALFATTAASATPAPILIEAESFTDYGGWSLDTQFVHIMGSPYLLAHGLGEPVKDATTTVKFPALGSYKVFVRTKDWVAHWNVPGQPGRFQLLVDGKPLPASFGAQGADWFWQDGGTIEVTKTELPIALHDLTGFEGRCDAIVFVKDPAFIPPNDLPTMTAWRKQVLGLPDKPVEAGEFDLVVVGGGYSGMGAAISGARMGCKVALIQDRPVLGGNGSSEIRVWSMGGTTTGKFPRLGEIVEEFADNAKASPGTPDEFGDEKKEAIVRNEKNITLFLNTRAYAVEMKDGKVAAVLTRNTKTSEETRFTGKFFADTTGHGVIGALAGADFDMAEQGHMGMSNMWRWTDTGKPQTFPDVPWALDLSMEDFPYPKRGMAEWFWEGGFNRHPITDLELIRDWNFRAAYGAFNAMKNKDGKAQHVNAKMEWLAYIGGNRESRLLRGDVILTREDIVNKKDFPDGCVPTTWSIDLHVPKEQYAKKFPEDPFISKAIFDGRVDKQNGYPIPYRCFYSRNIPNLFMAGREISVNREALGTIRVMRTCGMMGEVVGKAASICIKEHCTPRDVYALHWDELKDLMNLPGRARRETVNDPIRPDAPLPEVSLHPAPPQRPAAATPAKGIDPKTLDGIIIDDKDAKLTGAWVAGKGATTFIGPGYQHDGNTAKGEKSALFEFKVPTAGRYEVRLAYQAGDSRATNVPVTIHSADGDKTVPVNEQEPPPLDHGFVSLGTFSFDPAIPGSVIVSNKGTQGHVVIDAIQVIPAK